MIAITYRYWCDHREDFKQWTLALVTTHGGDVPLFLQPLDSNSSDKVSLIAAVTTIQAQLREAEGEPSISTSDNGIYSTPNMQQLNVTGVKWISRVSEISTQAKTILQAGSQEWQTAEDGSIEWYSRVISLRKEANAGSLCARSLSNSEHACLATGGKSCLGQEVLASGQAALCS